MASIKVIAASALCLTTLGIHGQSVSEELARFAGNVHQFNEFYPQEKVYLQFDNTSYFSGDTIWFKSYVVEASTLNRAPSKVLYVDLLSARGTVLRQLKLRVEAGQADGYIALCDETASALRGAIGYPGGYYEVRAYTSNMLNFSEQSVFSRVFPVYDKEDIDQIPVLAQEKVQFRKEPQKGADLDIQFFPESGNLVRGIPSVVAFKATNSLGAGVNVKGTLSNGTTVETIHDGMGQFTIVPQGQTKMSVEYEGKRYSFTIPAAQESGYVLSAQQSDDAYQVMIQSAGVQKKEMALIMMCRGEVFSYNEITSGTESVSIQKEGIPEGVCQFILYDKSGRKLCSRMVYNHSRQEYPQIYVQADKASYSPFEKVTMDVRLTDHDASYRDRICLSVRDGSIKSVNSQDDLRSFMLLASDLKGLINKPGYYFEAEDNEHRMALDLLMLVQGWERYDWKYMSGQKKYVERHRMEDSLSLNGWVLSPFLKKEMNNVTFDAVVIQPETHKLERFSLATAQGGYFGLNMSDFYGNATVKIWTTPKRHRKAGTDCRLLMERSELPTARQLAFLDILSDANSADLLDMSKSGIRKMFVPDSRKGDIQELKPDTTVRNLAEGFILPDVSIFGKRQFVDYDTFIAFDAERDVERAKDRGEFTTDLEGYLISKGVNIKAFDAAFSTIGDNEGDCARFCPPSPISFGSGGDTRAYYTSDSRTTNFYPETAVQEVNFRHVLPQIAENINTSNQPESWALSTDMDNIKAIYVFDDKVRKANLKNLAGEFQKASGRKAFYVNTVSEKRSLDFVVVELKSSDQLKSHSELYNIGDRDLQIQGFTRQEAQFYSPQYPDGAVPGEVDYRRTLYWNPNVITDADGKAQIEFYNNSYSTRFKVSAAGMTAGGTPYVLEQDF